MAKVGYAHSRGDCFTRFCGCFPLRIPCVICSLPIRQGELVQLCSLRRKRRGVIAARRYRSSLALPKPMEEKPKKSQRKLLNRGAILLLVLVLYVPSAGPV